ncbi:MAG: hypothetical protein U0872_01775 [Planctomycetaceae bacterium]
MTNCTRWSAPGAAWKGRRCIELAQTLLFAENRTASATTLDEYRKYIEKDLALERRFQPILVNEPSVEDTISILRGLKERYESHHGVRITDDALISAATLSDRYINDRFLPDKVIDLVDEAASRLRMEMDSMPAEIDEATRQLTRMQIEAAALSKETTPDSQSRLQTLRKEIAEREESVTALKARWEAEKSALSGLRPLKEDIEKLRTAYEQALNQRMHEFQRRLCPRIPDRAATGKPQQKLLKPNRKSPASGKGSETAREVTQEDIAKVVSH